MAATGVCHQKLELRRNFCSIPIKTQLAYTILKFSMSCPSCSRRILQLFVREATGIHLPAHSSATSFRNRYRLPQQSSSLQTPLRLHNAFSQRRRISTVSAADDADSNDAQSHAISDVSAEEGQSDEPANIAKINKRISKNKETKKSASDKKPKAIPEKKNASKERSDTASASSSKTSPNSDPKVTGQAPQQPKAKREQWQIQKEALQEKFKGEAWKPRKRLSPDAIDAIRAFHVQDPEQFSTAALAEKFKVSPEAIRRILKSKWRPSEEEQEDRLRRWDKRGQTIWAKQVEMGIRPPKKWREMGIGKAEPGKAPKWKWRAGKGEKQPAPKAEKGEDVPWAEPAESNNRPRFGQRNGEDSLADRIL